MTTKPTTITLTASQLHALLGDVLPFVDTGQGLPVLECVHLDGHGDHLTAGATDRYTLGVRKLDVPAPKTLHVNIDRRVARQIMSTFKPRRSDDPTLTLSFSEGRVTVEAGGALDGLLLDARMSFSLYVGDYPRIGGILEKEETLGDGSMTLSAEFLSRFKHLGRLALHPTGANSVCIVRADGFIGAIMPQRTESGELESWRTRDLAEWKSFIDLKPAAKPARKGAAA